MLANAVKSLRQQKAHVRPVYNRFSIRRRQYGFMRDEVQNPIRIKRPSADRERYYSPQTTQKVTSQVPLKQFERSQRAKSLRQQKSQQSPVAPLEMKVATLISRFESSLAVRTRFQIAQELLAAISQIPDSFNLVMKVGKLLVEFYPTNKKEILAAKGAILEEEGIEPSTYQVIVQNQLKDSAEDLKGNANNIALLAKFTKACARAFLIDEATKAIQKLHLIAQAYRLFMDGVDREFVQVKKATSEEEMRQVMAEAKELYQKAIKSNPQFSEAYTNLGVMAFYRENNAQHAAQLLEEAVRVDTKSKNSIAHYHLGVIYETHFKDPMKCKVHYAKAAEIDPKHYQSHTALGGLLMEEDNFQEALSHYRAARDAAGYEPLVHYNLANCYNKLGALEGALKSSDEAIEIDPRDPMGYYMKGLIYMTNGMLVESIDYFRRSIKFSGDYADFPFDTSKPLNNILFILKTQSSRLMSVARTQLEYENAGALLRQALDLSAEEGDGGVVAVSWANLTFCYMKSKQIVSAIDALSEAITLGGPEFLQEYATIKAENTNIELSEQLASHLVRLESSDCKEDAKLRASVHLNTAFCMLHMGDLEGTLQHLQESYKLDQNADSIYIYPTEEEAAHSRAEERRAAKETIQKEHEAAGVFVDKEVPTPEEIETARRVLLKFKSGDMGGETLDKALKMSMETQERSTEAASSPNDSANDTQIHFMADDEDNVAPIPDVIEGEPRSTPGLYDSGSLAQEDLEFLPEGVLNILKSDPSYKEEEGIKLSSDSYATLVYDEETQEVVHEHLPTDPMADYGWRVMQKAGELYEQLPDLSPEERNKALAELGVSKDVQQDPLLRESMARIKAQKSINQINHKKVMVIGKKAKFQKMEADENQTGPQFFDNDVFLPNFDLRESVRERFLYDEPLEAEETEVITDEEVQALYDLDLNLPDGRKMEPRDLLKRIDNPVDMEVPDEEMLKMYEFVQNRYNEVCKNQEVAIDKLMGQRDILAQYLANDDPSKAVPPEVYAKAVKDKQMENAGRLVGRMMLKNALTSVGKELRKRRKAAKK